MKKLNFKLTSFLILISLALGSCTSTRTALFDQYSYQKTTEIKVETIQLLNQANTPFEAHKEKVQSILLSIEKLAEYEKNKPNNEITFAMWQVLNDKEKNLLAGFFKIWEKKGIVSPVFQEEAKKQISDALDLLIQYEIKKDKESKELLLDLIKLNS